jgi:mannonate dehydratase
MNFTENQNEFSRRNAMKLLTAGSAAGLLGLFGTRNQEAGTYETPSYAKGMPQVKIKSVRSIANSS